MVDKIRLKQMSFPAFGMKVTTVLLVFPALGLAGLGTFIAVVCVQLQNESKLMKAS